MISKVKPVVEDEGEEKAWYESWFDSPYYHILYKDRDEREAEIFLDNLINITKLKTGATVLDVACGRGRHSLYLNRKGYDVTGFDLSEESILSNKKLENDRLHFYLHDMREIFRSNYFDMVLNLFSSFGYFEKKQDNFRCITSSVTALKTGGLYILDFFNSNKIRHCEELSYQKTVDGIVFNIRKKTEGKRVIKKIDFIDSSVEYHYEEQVTLYDLHEFESFFREAGLKIISIFGNYSLEEYHPDFSERMIFLTSKI